MYMDVQLHVKVVLYSPMYVVVHFHVFAVLYMDVYVMIHIPTYGTVNPLVEVLCKMYCASIHNPHMGGAMYNVHARIHDAVHSSMFTRSYIDLRVRGALRLHVHDAAHSRARSVIHQHQHALRAR